MAAYVFPITFEHECKQYYTYSQDFPGVYGLGETVVEANKSILRVMRLYNAHYRKTRKQVPILHFTRGRARF